MQIRTVTFNSARLYEAILMLCGSEVQRKDMLDHPLLQRYLIMRAIKLHGETKRGALQMSSVSFEIVISDLRRGWFTRKSC